MADFYEVWSCRASVLMKLDAMLEARNAARQQELQAATDIKRVYRGKVCKQLMPRVHHNYIHVSRLCRPRHASVLFRDSKGKIGHNIDGDMNKIYRAFSWAHGCVSEWREDLSSSCIGQAKKVTLSSDNRSTAFTCRPFGTISTGRERR